MHDLDSTLVAVATPPGRGGVGCVRLSGSRSEEIALRMFESRGRRPAAGRRPTFGRFLDRDGKAIDHGYLVLFRAEASYTGERTAELWPHGSPVVLAELIESALAAGAQAAGPGEFTYRALHNGRLDLARAEAVRDLVAARTRFQARVAYSQAEGALSQRIEPLREMLIDWIARAEAAVEFVDESETHLPPAAFRRAIDGTRDLCAELLAGFDRGRVVRSGATLAVVGLPNTGKSSLFNRLLARERAIVTEHAGTTRDTLEEDLDLDGIPLRLIDTAGLRDADHPVESEGVRRAKRAREEADLVLLVLDGSRLVEPSELAALRRAEAPEESERTVAVVNKCDLHELADLPPDLSRVSALTGAGTDRLRVALRERLVGAGPLEDPIVSDARHATALRKAGAALDRAAAALRSGLSEELVLEDLKEALRRLGEITGEVGSEELYDRIFSTFCIGK